MCLHVFSVRVFFNYFLFLYCVCHAVEWHSPFSTLIAAHFRCIYCVAFCLAISIVSSVFVVCVSCHCFYRKYETISGINECTPLVLSNMGKENRNERACIYHSYKHTIHGRTEEQKNRNKENGGHWKTNPFRFIICQRHRSPRIRSAFSSMRWCAVGVAFFGWFGSLEFIVNAQFSRRTRKLKKQNWFCNSAKYWHTNSSCTHLRSKRCCCGSVMLLIAIIPFHK